MRVGYIQYDVRRNPEENYAYVRNALPKMDCDVVVLPELCVSGYLFGSKADLLRAAEPVPEGPTTRTMLALSARQHCTIVFGLAERMGDAIYNTAVVVKDGTYLGKYQKIHLSDLEKQLFTRGTGNRVFDLGSCKLGVQICFDLWFPEVSREQIRLGADLLCVPANFGGEETYIIAQTRAMENLTPLVLCNRVGTEATETIDAFFLGKSTILSPSGQRLQVEPASQEGFACCEIALGGTRSNVICSDFDAEIAFHRP